MKDDFYIKIETWHKPDTGLLENVSPPAELFHMEQSDRCLHCDPFVLDTGSPVLL